MNNVTGKLQVKMLLGAKRWNDPLRNGGILSNRVELDLHNPAEISDEFKPFVRKQIYDCGELAIVTHLQAIAYGKPFILLPFVVSGRHHHKSFACNADRSDINLSSLAGKRIGVRTYSQTTGVWVRGILRDEFDADFSKTSFITFDDAHLAEHVDPANCTRAAPGKKLMSMLLDGELDAGLLGSNMPTDGTLRSVVPDPVLADLAWEAKYGVTPINHMFVVTKDFARKHPEAVRAVFGMLVEASHGREQVFPIGLNANWKALEIISEYAFQQKVIPRRISIDELFGPVAEILR